MTMQRALWVLCATLAVGCDDGADDPAPMNELGVDAAAQPEPQPEAEPEGQPEPQPEAEPEMTGEPEAPPPADGWRCVYTNPFSQGTDCKQYTGAGWTAARVEEDCAAVFANTAGTVERGACAFEQELGRCAVGDPAGDAYVLVSEGADPGQCGLTQSACETFAQGTFTAGAICDVCVAGEPGETGFNQPTLNCRPPLEGEPAGQGPDGEVCTWNHISGSTEPGRFYADYGDCSAVLDGGRPYFPIANPIEQSPDDPRLADETWMAEAAWVTEQIEASACTCCHSNSATPAGGYAVWDTQAGPLWFDQFSKPGLAMMAGLVNSDSFGAFDPAVNNGFDRRTTGAPTTDVARMQAFFTAEFERRGGTEQDLAGYSDFGGPLAAQLSYVPEACPDGTGVMPDGTLMWGGGPARYVYVIAEGGENVGPPPNLDVPADTLWMLSVPATAPAIGCGGAYGAVPEGVEQRVPAAGEAPSLEPGQTYYFVVLRDIALPLERCLFTYDG